MAESKPASYRSPPAAVAATMNYAELPEEILDKIVRHHLVTLSQIISFFQVCQSWRSAALRSIDRRDGPCFPGLLTSSKSAASQSPVEAYRSGQPLDFLSLDILSLPTGPPSPAPPRITLPYFPSPSKISDDVHRHRYTQLLHRELLTPAPSAGKTYCLGSKDGWILRTLPCRGRRHRRPLELYLLNPITGVSIPLPPLPTASSPLTLKGFISSPPDDQAECHVFVVHQDHWAQSGVAWCKVGPGSGSGSGPGWEFIQPAVNSRLSHAWPKAACFSDDGKLYVLNYFSVYVVDLLSIITTSYGLLSPTMEFSFPLSLRAFGPVTAPYLRLCHVNGHLHLVTRHCDADSVTFRVYKMVMLDARNNNYGWKEVRSFDGDAVFIGSHQSFSLPAAGAGDGTAVNGVVGDRIYFVTSCRVSGIDSAGWSGAFDLVDQKFERFDLHDQTMFHTFWFLTMPWDISKLHDKHSHAKNARKQERLVRTKNDKKKNDDDDDGDGGEVTGPCHNRFEALLLASDDETEDNER